MVFPAALLKQQNDYPWCLLVKVLLVSMWLRILMTRLVRPPASSLMFVTQFLAGIGVVVPIGWAIIIGPLAAS